MITRHALDVEPDRRPAVQLAPYLQTPGLVLDRLSVRYVPGRYTAGQTSKPVDLLPFLDQAMLR